jgi:hypothetical protein
MVEQINNYIKNDIINDVPCIYSTLTCKNKIEEYKPNTKISKFINVTKYSKIKKIISDFYKPLLVLVFCFNIIIQIIWL